MQRGGIGVAHVFAGQDHQPPGEKADILAPFEHPRQPIQGRVGIAAANALDQRADAVVVRIAVPIVLHRLSLQRFRGQLAGELHRPVGAGEHAHLQGREGPAGVAVARFREEIQGILVQPHLVLAQAAAGVGRGAAEQRLDVVAR